MYKNKSIKRQINISKKWTYILRHAANEYNLNISSDGFVLIDDLLKLDKFNSTNLNEILEIVKNNSKKRFEVKKENDLWFIRATQGHSIKTIEDDKLLENLKTLEEVGDIFHGSFYKLMDLIMDSGLKSMTRNHIHFAVGLPNNIKVISGMRQISEIYYTINVKKALVNGIKFFISTNKVILSRGFNGTISPIYFNKVCDLKSNKLLYDMENKNDLQKIIDKFLPKYLINLYLEKKDNLISLYLSLIDYQNKNITQELNKSFNLNSDIDEIFMENLLKIIEDFIKSNDLSVNDIKFIINNKINLIKKLFKNSNTNIFKNVFILNDVLKFKFDIKEDINLDKLWEILNIKEFENLEKFNKINKIIVEILKKDIEFDKELLVEIN